MTNPTAAFLVIGDEILSGRTQDVNVRFLAERLAAAGIGLKEVRIVADDPKAIGDAVNRLRQKWNNVFTSGGIGPTHDDITADSIAAAMNTPIDVRADALALLKKHYKNSGTELNTARLRMARIPDGATLIDNPVSTAPGFSLQNVHVMAGVPAIFQAMVTSVLPTLTGGVPVRSRNIRLDMPEGEISGPLGILAKKFPTISFGCYPFIQNGKFGANVVLRGTDTDVLATATDNLLAQFPVGTEQ